MSEMGMEMVGMGMVGDGDGGRWRWDGRHGRMWMMCVLGRVSGDG